METTATVLSTFISNLGSMVTASVSWMGSVLSFITSNPVLYVPLLLFFVTGGVIGLIMRILRG